MATLTLKNVPDDLLEGLKEAAAANDRSMNREAILLLKIALAQVRDRPNPQDTVERLRRFRESLPAAARAVTMDEIEEYIREGRE